MSTIELRHIIIDHISHIDDVTFLNALKTILESKVTEGKYNLSDYQKKRIDSARRQLKKGQTLSNEALQKEIDLWLTIK